MHGGFFLPDMLTLLPTIPALAMIAGFFAIFADLFGPLFNIVIRLFELVPLMFNPTLLANEIITGITVGISIIYEAIMGFLNPAKYMKTTKEIKTKALDTIKENCYSTSFMSILLLIICPPFAVYQAYGFAIHEIFFCTLLIIYGYYFPGLIYAIMVINPILKKKMNNKCKT